MKKLFLTSGVILCMACPAFATNDITAAGKDATNTSITANCTNTYLGSYTGPVSYDAKWNPHIAGPIALDQYCYADSSTKKSISLSPTPLYSVYGVGIYSEAVTLSNYQSKTPVTSITKGSVTGWTFQGIYTAKSGTATQVVNSSGTVLAAANTALSGDGDTTTWYARCCPNISGAITLDSDLWSSSTATTKSRTAGTQAATTPLYTAYDYGVYTTKPTCSNYTSNTYAKLGTVPALTGYTFGGFYTTKSGTGDQVIDSSGNWTTNTKNRISTIDGTATWWAKWTANKYNVVYNVGDCGGTAYTHTNGATYDSNYSVLTLASSGMTVTRPEGTADTGGYTFDGWTTDSTVTYGSSSPYNLTNAYTGASPWTRTSTLNLYGACHPNISGAITLDSDLWASSDATSTTRTAGTQASASTLYSVYKYGIYTTKPNKSNYKTAEKYTKLATVPALTGYTFGGFYTTKSGTGTQVIDSGGNWVTSGTGQTNAQVKTTDGTAKFWAKWTANCYGAKTFDNSIYTSASGNATYTTSTTGDEKVTASSPTSAYTKYDSTALWNSTCSTSQSFTAPTHQGYTFVGYFNSQANAYAAIANSGTTTGKKTNNSGTLLSSTSTDGAETWYAGWTPKKFNVIYNKGTGCGGSAYTHTNGLTYDANYTLINPGGTNQTVTVPTGYVFNGWSTSSSVSYSSNTLQNAAANLTPSKKTANWNLYGACTPAISGKITIKSGSSGCYVDSSTTVAATISSTSVYSVYGTGLYSTAPTKANYSSATALTSITASSVASGYTYQGIYTSATGTTQVIAADGTINSAAKTQVTADGTTKTWYPQCCPNISGQIALDSKIYRTAGSTPDYTPTTSAGTTPLYTAYNYGVYTTAPTCSNYRTATKYTQLGTLPSAITGYTFDGFYTEKQNATGSGTSGTKVINADGTFTVDAKTRISATNGTATWYAKWKPATPTTTWSCGTHSGTVSNGIQFVYDTAFTMPTTATGCNAVNGEHFKGWSCSYDPTTGSGSATFVGSRTCGTCSAGTANTCTYSGSGTFKGTTAITCTAIWEKNTVCPITWYKNDGTSGTVSGTGTDQCTYDGTLTLPTNPTRTGYTFNGWTVRQ